MKNRNRVVLLLAVFYLLLPVSAFAGNTESINKWLNFAYIWGPLIAMGIWFYYVAKRYAKLQKRSYEHMDRAEQLLERIAKAVEQNQK